MRATSTRITARADESCGKCAASFVEAVGARLDDGPAAVEAHDARRPVEGTEHQHDASVLAQVRDRLDAAAGEIEVRDAVRAEHGERVESFRREVHHPVASERRRRDEEHALAQQPLAHALVDRFEDLAHAFPSQSGSISSMRLPNGSAT